MASASGTIPSDDDIVKEIGTVLNSVDLATTTMNGIKQQLEKNLGFDVSDKKVFIREQVDLYLSQHTDLGPLQKVQEGDEDPEKENGKQPLQTSAEEAEHDQELEQFRENIEQAIVEESSPKEKKKRGGLNKVCRLSPELQAIIGEESLPRTQVVKQLWVYIRAHNLQDPENKRNIICDEALKELFGQDSTDMFQMNKLLSKHIWSIAAPEGEETESKSKRQKVEKKESGKGKVSGFLVPSPISDSLQKFFGTGESEVARSEVVKRIWEYIRTNHLQDPTDKRTILCDNKLRELFECDSFVGFSMTKLLASHFVKT